MSSELPLIVLSKMFITMLNLDDAALYALKPVFCTRVERLTSTNRFLDRALVVTQSGELLLFDIDTKKRVTHRFSLGKDRTKLFLDVSLERQKRDDDNAQCVRIKTVETPNKEQSSPKPHVADVVALYAKSGDVFDLTLRFHAAKEALALKFTTVVRHFLSVPYDTRPSATTDEKKNFCIRVCDFSIGESVKSLRSPAAVVKSAIKGLRRKQYVDITRMKKEKSEDACETLAGSGDTCDVLSGADDWREVDKDVVVANRHAKLEKMKVSADRPVWVIRAPPEDDHFALMSFSYYRRGVLRSGGTDGASAVPASAAINSSGHLHLTGSQEGSGSLGFPLTDVLQAQVTITSRHTVNKLLLGTVALTHKAGNKYTLEFGAESAGAMHLDDAPCTSLEYLAQVIRHHSPKTAVSVVYPLSPGAAAIEADQFDLEANAGEDGSFLPFVEPLAFTLPSALVLATIAAKQRQDRQLALLIYSICRDRLDSMERSRLQNFHVNVKFPVMGRRTV